MCKSIPLMIRYFGRLTKSGHRSGSKEDAIEMLELASKEEVRSCIEPLDSE